MSYVPGMTHKNFAIPHFGIVRLAAVILLSSVITGAFAGGYLRSDFSVAAIAMQSQTDPTQPQIGPGVPNTGSNAARSAAASSKPGSILFYPRFTSDISRPNLINTLMTVTNTNPKDSVIVRIFYVYNGLIDERFVTLVPNQSMTFLASREVPGETGYMIALAVNSMGLPTQFNWLIGNAHIMDNHGHEAGYNAFSAAKRSAGQVKINAQEYTADLLFNGVEYDRLPKVVAIDSLQNQDNVAGPAVKTDISVISPISDLSGLLANSFHLEATAYDYSGTGWLQKHSVSFALYSDPSSIWTAPQFNTVVSANRSGWATFKAKDDQDNDLPVIGLSLTDGEKEPLHNARIMQALDWVQSCKITVPVRFPDNPVDDVVTTDLPAATNSSQGASESRAGSILIYPRYVTGENGATRIMVTNTNPTQKIKLRAFFSGLAGTPEVKETIISLQNLQTIVINPDEFSPNQKGWVMIVAIDNRALPVQFNHLIGSAQVEETGGLKTSFNALAVGKNTTEDVKRNDDNETADLIFDGGNYDRLPATTGLAFVPNQTENNTAVGFARPSASMLEPPNTRGAASLMLYDDKANAFNASIPRNEARLSQVRPSAIQPPVTSTILSGENGWLKITSFTPILPWAINQSLSPFNVVGNNGWRGGISGDGNLHILSTADTQSIKIPSINPNNNPPTALAETIGLQVEARRAGGTIVRLDGTDSSDPDIDDPLSFKWSDNNQVISTARVSDRNLSIGSHTISLVVTDGNGASSSAEDQTVTVVDTTPPQISGLPSTVNLVTASDSGGAVSFDMPVAFDMVDGIVAVKSSKASGSVFQIGKTLVTFTAKDKAGNSSTASLEVNVANGSTAAQIGGVAASKAPRMGNLNDQFVAAGEVRDIALQAEDPDGDPVTFNLSGNSPYAWIISGNPGDRTAVLRIAPKKGDPAVSGNLRVVALDSRGQAFTTLPFRITISDIPNDNSGSGNSLNKPPIVSILPFPGTIQATTKFGADLTLDASGSSDPDRDSLSFTWYDGDVVIGKGPVINIQLKVGIHDIKVVVFDGNDGITTGGPYMVDILPRDLAVFTASPNRLNRNTTVNLILTGTGFHPASEIRFGKDGLNILNYISIEEDRIAVTVEVTAGTTLGFRDVYVINPNGKSVRLRSGLFVNP